MEHNFRFYIVYPIPFHDATIETTHEGFSAFVDSLKTKYEIKKETRKEVICGETHVFLSVYVFVDEVRFLIGWIHETIYD